jgi:hypothetical protein
MQDVARTRKHNQLIACYYEQFFVSMGDLSECTGDDYDALSKVKMRMQLADLQHPRRKLLYGCQCLSE